ncbi:MAG: hypothetical protein IH623_15785 [Verrucomicrobia bacterium]|nr:hypothetical protein [Verrucomicrobiota bacterium]
MYFQPEPHRRLYVEVDAVEGTEFSATELAELEAVLREWTQKPDGVAVVQSSLIPRHAARGHSADSLARRYLDGPPATTNEFPSAYLYILVYDNRVNRNPMQSPRAASLWPARDSVPARLAAPEDPRVVAFPYPAMIYVDRSWLGGLLPKKYWQRTLLHEAGHILGLVGRESQVERRHCATKWCLMNAHTSENIKSDILNWLTRRKQKPDLCEACATELRQYQTAIDKISTRFAGPVLVRTMPSYQVLALPAFCGLVIGEAVDANIPRFVEEFRRLEGQKGLWFATLVQDDLDLESLLQAIEAAKQDFDPTVRENAHKLERKVRED